MLRWAIPTSEVEDQPTFNALVKLLPKDDAEDVLRFRNADDRRRALLSRLAQRAAPAAALGLALPVRRRAANGRGRPFLCRRSSNLDADDAALTAAAPNWNYSASHEGGWVALAAEPLALCGVDVAAPRFGRRTNGKSFLESMDLLRESFTDAEWEKMEEKGGRGDQHDDDSDLLAEAAFLRLWAVKEAFVKARGDGLAFGSLRRVEAVFDHDVQRSAFDDPAKIAAASASGACLAAGTLSIDGGPPQWGRWAVAVHPLPVLGEEEDQKEEDLSPCTPGASPVPSNNNTNRHRRRCWLAVVRGPPSETAPRELHPEFVESLARRSLDGEELKSVVQEAAWVPFRVLKVGDLLLDEGERDGVAEAVAGAGERGGG